MTIRISNRRSINGAGLDITTGNMDIYVSPAGNDLTGTGEVGAPYATFDRVFEDIPTYVEHIVHVHVAVGAYTSFPANPGKVTLGGGQIVLDASAAAVEVATGLAIAGGGWASLEDYTAADITEAVGGLTPGAWADMFIEFTSGARNGMIASIMTNTATVVRIGPWGTAPAPGDTFRVIQPGASITVAHDVFCDDVDIVFAGIEYSAAANFLYMRGQSTLRPAGSTFDTTVSINRCSMDAYGTGILAIDEAGWNATWESAGILLGWIMIENGVASACQHDGRIQVRGVSTVSYAAATERFVAFTSSNVVVGSVYRENAAEDGFEVAEGAFLYVLRAFIEAATNAFDMAEGSSALLYGIDGNGANVSGYTLSMDRGARVVAEKATCTLVGTTNAVEWVNGAAALPALPNQDVVATDAAGAEVVGI